MRKTIATIVGAAAITGGIALAAPAQATPFCSYFGSNASRTICGTPNISQSIQNAQKNLQSNFNIQGALTNLQHSLTGIGSDPSA